MGLPTHASTPTSTPIVLMEDAFWEFSDAVEDCLLESGYWVVRAQSAREAALTVDCYGARLVIAPEARAHQDCVEALLRLTETRPSPPTIIRIPDGELEQLRDTVITHANATFNRAPAA